MLSKREAAIWAACFLLVSVLIVATGFVSADPDSALYAGITERLASLPLSEWIAPQWWGFWNGNGWFREHPAGVYLFPTLLAKLGVPAVQASYVVGVATGLGSLLGIGWLVSRITTVREGRAALVFLQLMPVASLFRIRANHEYPMLLALVGTLIALDRVRQSWWAVLLLAASLTFGLLVKGVFVIVIFIAAGLWIVLNPPRTPGSMWRPIIAMAASIAMMIAIAIWYDQAYFRITGDPFWISYWQKQLAPVEVATPFANAKALAYHLVFYLGVLIWHGAPWSLAIISGLVATRGRVREALRHLAPAESRGIIFVAALTICMLALLSPSGRYAERYMFSLVYATATLGTVIAMRRWPICSRAIGALEMRVVALPAIVWAIAVLGRLLIGPLLPRV